MSTRDGSLGGSGGGGRGGAYVSIISQLQNLLSRSLSTKIIQSDQIYHIVALLFGRPYSPVIRDTIVPRLDYWHHRSGNHIDFFCIGFFGGESVPVEKGFDDYDFVRAVRSFEERSKWRYSGETDLVILNAVYNAQKRQVQLDFSTVLTITLERAIEVKAIPSVPIFLEQMIHWAKEYEGANPTWDFSDSRGINLAGDALKKFLISFLPDKVSDNITKAFHFYTKDLSKL